MFPVLFKLIVSGNLFFFALFAPLIPSVFFLFWVKLWVKASRRSPCKDLPVQTLLPPN